jgi:hypothetical protein
MSTSYEGYRPPSVAPAQSLRLMRMVGYCRLSKSEDGHGLAVQWK